ncbi:MAG TPA: hypothetical protein VGF92_08095 [Stellaceae bacterium]|jgi:hypothetical protein
MAAKKANTTPVGQPSEQQQATEHANFPHAVESPYRAGWEHALTEKCGVRGKTWTSTKSMPQWTVRFRNSEAAAWFKKTWTAEAW